MEKRLKVLHLISGGDRGGAKTHMFAMLERLTVYADVAVVCLMEGEFYAEILDRPVRTVLFRQKSRNDLSVCGEIAAMVNGEGFDIVNAHGARANFIALFLRGKINVPVVTTIHSDPDLDFEQLYKRLVFGGLNKLALRRLRYKIAVSDAFRDMLVGRGFRPNDIAVVYNGLKFDNDDGSPTCLPSSTREEFAAKHRFPYSPDDIYIGTAARLDRVKGVDILLDAAAKVLAEEKNVRFVIIGGGAERDTLYAQMRALGIADRVHFLGHVTEIYDFHNVIDINVIPSRSESFSYAMLEGANASKATVAAAVGGIPRLIRDGDTGLLFPPEDADALADKLRYLIRDRNNGGGEIERLGARLREYARANYSSDALARGYIGCYRRFIGYYNDEKRNDIVLAGYYGFGNLGDELLLSALVSAIKKASPGVRITALSKDVRGLERSLGVNAVGRFNPFAVAKLLDRSKLLALGGGSLIQDATSRKSLLYYLTLVDEAHRRGLKTAITAGGVGPLMTEGSVRRAAATLNKLDGATLRDSGSARFFAERCPGVPARLTADAAFLLSFDKPPEASDYFVITPRPPVKPRDVPPGFMDALADAAAEYAKVSKLRAVVLPMQPETDVKMCRRLTAELIKRGAEASTGDGGGADGQLRLIAGARLVLGMRLHSLICAAACGVPVAGIAYDEKVAAFLREAKLPEPVRLTEEATSERLLGALNGARSPENIGKLRELARLSVTELLKLL